MRGRLSRLRISARLFSCYPPNSSVYHVVEQSGELSKDDGDTKIASSKIKIGAEIGIPGLVKAAIEYTKERVISEIENENSGYQGAATNSGDQGAATNSGYQGAAVSTGQKGAAISENEASIAVSWGVDGIAKGVIGSYLVLTDWRENKDGEYELKGAKMIVIDGEKYKENTFYTIRNGKIVEVK